MVDWWWWLSKPIADTGWRRMKNTRGYNSTHVQSKTANSIKDSPAEQA